MGSVLPHFSPAGGFAAAAVERRVAAVEILGIQVVLHLPQCFAETLEVHDFPLPQELDRVADIGVIAQPENVVVGAPCLLLCRHILGQVGDRIPLGLEIGSRERYAGGTLGIQSEGVVYEVRVESGFLDLFRCQPVSQLVQDRGNHLDMG